MALIIVKTELRAEIESIDVSVPGGQVEAMPSGNAKVTLTLHLLGPTSELTKLDDAWSAGLATDPIGFLVAARDSGLIR